MKIKVACLILVLFCCHAYAEIYQCLNQDNHIEFRDKPCEANSIEQHVMTEEPQFTVNLMETNASKNNLDLAKQHNYKLENIKANELKKIKQQKAEKKKVLAEHKKVLIAQKAERKALRLKKREEKLALKAAQKKDKQIKKQKKLSEKIQKIENQLRLGSKLKKHSELPIELEKARKKLQEKEGTQNADKTYHLEQSCQNPS